MYLCFRWRRIIPTYIDMGGSLRYMYENADRAQSWGVELDVRKNLGFIGMPNLSLVLNAAWIYSNVTFVPGEVVSEPDRPMQGQSPYVINAGLYYSSERLGLDVALLYNRIGNNQTSDHLVNVAEVKEMVDEAIDRGGKKGLFGKVKKSRLDEFGHTILLEKDFEI